MATHSNEAKMNNNTDATGPPYSPPIGECKKRGKASTPTSKDSTEPESEEKRVKGSSTEISNSGNDADIHDEMMEEDNARKKLASEDMQENHEKGKDEMMEDAGDNPIEVPLLLSGEEEEHNKTRKGQKNQNKGDESNEETSGMDAGNKLKELGFQEIIGSTLSTEIHLLLIAQ